MNKRKKFSDAIPQIGQFTPASPGSIDTKKDVLIEETEKHPNWHWDKHDIESPTSAPIMDVEQGKQVLMRRFLVTVPKEIEKVEGIIGARLKVKKPPHLTNEYFYPELIEFHKRHMLEELRRDGWEPFMEPKVSLVRWASLSMEDRATLPPAVMHNWIYAIIWHCHAEYGVIREATHQAPHSATALMNEAAKRQQRQ